MIVCALIGLLLLGLPRAAPAGEEGPLTLHGWLEAKGRDTSFAARKVAFERTYVGERYRGTLEQNMRWLQDLRGRRPAAVHRGAASSGARPALHELCQLGWTLRIDRSAQVLHLDVPKDVRWEYAAPEGGEVDSTWPRKAVPDKIVSGEPPLSAQLELPAGPIFVPAGLLALKAKQFDDGLYAAVELAASRGHGLFPGKRALLAAVTAALGKQGACAEGNGPAVLFAATGLENRHQRYPACVAEAARSARKAFLADKWRSKPLGFYTWLPELERIFRQDRMLQSRLEGDEGIAALVAVLEADPSARAAYQAALSLHARLTNAPVAQDLRARYGGKKPPLGRKGLRFYPPSRSHEVDLCERLWGDRPVPEGADLMGELIQRIQGGSVSLAPRPDSGWYDHQTFALEPLLRPEQVPEADRLSFSQSYRKYLVELFKGSLALTRETHIKQLDLGACGAAMPVPTFHVSPGLSVEPLATHYARRAEAYRFVRGVLEQAFGRPALRGLQRRTADGPVHMDLDTELAFMEWLFEGAAQTAWAEIGAAQAGTDEGAEAARLIFRSWAGSLQGDPDLARDARMMVPVFWDQGRKLMKVWVFLGWQKRPLTISYKKTPTIGSLYGPKGKSSHKPEVQYRGQSVSLACPVMAEVYVSRLLDRAQFRAHCDKHKTRAAILGSLR